jgi:hypothetical protein
VALGDAAPGVARLGMEWRSRGVGSPEDLVGVLQGAQGAERWGRARPHGGAEEGVNLSGGAGPMFAAEVGWAAEW